MGPKAPSEPHRPRLRPPIYRFISINDPKDIKSRSKKRQVRSAVAYYQHHKNDNDDAKISTRLPDWKCREQSLVMLVRQESSQSTMSGTPSASTVLSTSPAPSTEEKLVWDTDGKVAYQPTTALCGTIMNPFDSYPVPWDPVYEPILYFYITHILIDTPAMSEPGKVFRLRTLWFPLVMTSKATFYAALSLAGCLMHANHQLAVDAPVLLEIRLRAISSIHNMLSDSEDCKTDQAIGAVLCLSALESFFGHAETFQMHMAGIAKMVRLRGGLVGLGLDGLLRRMIVWLDFNHATVYGLDIRGEY
ncbi:hypothetical protein BKA65DRAFT_471964 [Rhexocercosporidium sp. MPI-PUGE-AT-0058]|nr:hypothetical protein BKA65DRAFT_471964 [Rhexocercosporidium sp. MPI-PUGE-AT-0058]